MKKIILLLAIAITVLSCKKEDDTPNETNATVVFNFTHNWDDTPVNSSDFGEIQYTNAHGEQLSIDKLRYLISNIALTNEDGETTIFEGYNLVDLTSNSNLTYYPQIEIPAGTYTVSFTFGFDNENNIDGVYNDLNAASWNVPQMMGGGYHFMQMEGSFINDNSVSTFYQYHTIKAVDNTGPELVFQDTFFTVNLGEAIINNSSSIEVKMNIAEWYKNPNVWDLNVLNSSLMPNFDAQVMMSENGATVFSLGEITNLVLE